MTSSLTWYLQNRLTFYYPLAGLVNLVIYVLKTPHSTSVAADVSLMDIVVGHFGYLEYVSSSVLVFPFPREITSYTRRVVEKAKQASSQGGGVSTQVPDTIRLAGGDKPPEIAKQNSTLPLQAVNPVGYDLLCSRSMERANYNRICSLSLRTWTIFFWVWRICSRSGRLFPRSLQP